MRLVIEIVGSLVVIGLLVLGVDYLRRIIQRLLDKREPPNTGENT